MYGQELCVLSYFYGIWLYWNDSYVDKYILLFIVLQSLPIIYYSNCIVKKFFLWIMEHRVQTAIYLLPDSIIIVEIIKHYKQTRLKKTEASFNLAALANLWMSINYF